MNDIAHVYLYYGEENYKKRIYKDKLKNAVVGGNEINYAYFEGAGIDFGAVYDSVVTMPFFADKRLVVVENSGVFKSRRKKKDQEADEAETAEAADISDSSSDAAIQKILDNLPETTCLAFFEDTVDKKKKIYKDIASMGKVVECGKDDEDTVIRWLEKGFEKEGKKAERSALRMLVEQVGTDYDKLRQEYEKLLAYAGDSEVIRRADVEAISSEETESKIFDMLNAMSSRNTKGVLAKYYDLLENKEHPLYILAMIRGQFRTMLQTAELRNKGLNTQETAQALGKNKFVIERAEGFLRSGFRMKEVEEILEYIADTDMKIKSGLISDQLGVELMLVKFSSKR